MRDGRVNVMRELFVLSVVILATGYLHGGYKWDQSATSLALVRDDAVVVWRFNAGPDDSKPCFHPLTMPDGSVLTDFRPADHRWHRGAWFSWKFLDGQNYWEESAAGEPRQGWSRVENVALTPNPDFSADIELMMRYVEKSGVERLAEKRVMHVSAPQSDGSYTITVAMDVVALTDVVINRWYYGGFSLRMAKGREGWSFLDVNGVSGSTHVKQQNNHRLSRDPSPWVAYVEKQGEPTQGIAILDHRSNPFHPVRWLLLPHMPFMGPVFHYERDMRMNKGDSLKLRYRILTFKNQNATQFLNANQQKFDLQ